MPTVTGRCPNRHDGPDRDGNVWPLESCPICGGTNEYTASVEKLDLGQRVAVSMGYKVGDDQPKGENLRELAKEHALKANPMTHFLYLSFDSRDK